MILWQTESEVKKMPKQIGRPQSTNPKADRITVRLTEDEQKILQECAKEFGTTSADVLRRGLNLMEVEKNNTYARQLLDGMVLLDEYITKKNPDLIKKQKGQVKENFKWYYESIEK